MFNLIFAFSLIFYPSLTRTTSVMFFDQFSTWSCNLHLDYSLINLTLIGTHVICADRCLGFLISLSYPNVLINSVHDACSCLYLYIFQKKLSLHHRLLFFNFNSCSVLVWILFRFGSQTYFTICKSPHLYVIFGILTYFNVLTLLTHMPSPAKHIFLSIYSHFVSILVSSLDFISP